MATTITLSVLPEEIAAYCRRNQIRELALFGSVLRADFDAESDIDVLVDFELDAQIGFLALARMQLGLGQPGAEIVELEPA